MVDSIAGVCGREERIPVSTPVGVDLGESATQCADGVKNVVPIPFVIDAYSLPAILLIVQLESGTVC